jgi:hypothetical protein
VQLEAFFRMEKSVLPQKDFLKVSGKRFLFDFFKNQK